MSEPIDGPARGATTRLADRPWFQALKGALVVAWTGAQTGTQTDGRGLLERASDAVKDAVDPLDGKKDRR